MSATEFGARISRVIDLSTGARFDRDTDVAIRRGVCIICPFCYVNLENELYMFYRI